MKRLLLGGFLGLGILAASIFPALGGAIDVILATEQIPGNAGLSRVGFLGGGRWDRGGRIWMEGRYQPDWPSVSEPNAVWVWTEAGGAAQFYRDGDSVPYYPGGALGPVIPMSVPRLQPRLGGYEPPANYAVFDSAVASVPAAGGMLRAMWTRRLDLPGNLFAAYFLVNDLESHSDGTRQFLRPQFGNAIIRLRNPNASLDTNYLFRTEGGGAFQLYFNSDISEAGGASGSLVWHARSDLEGSVSGLSNVVRTLAASSGLNLPGLPGGRYSALRILGVDSHENLLWEAGTNGGTIVLRGPAGEWAPLLGPGMPAPPDRRIAPGAATPLGSVGAVGLVSHGAAFFAEATYGTAAGGLAGRTALLLHDGTTSKLFAREREVADGPGGPVELQRFTPGDYDWPDSTLVTFFGPVRGGGFPFERQALLFADEHSLRHLAIQNDPLPVPAGVDRIVQFRFPVLSARPDGTVAFAADVEFTDGRRQEILYLVKPGSPNRYQVILSSGDTFSLSTREGPRVHTIRGFRLAEWRPETFDKLLVTVDLQLAGASAVLLVDPFPAPPRIESSLVGGRLRLRWPVAAGATVESAASLTIQDWSAVTLPVTERDGFRELEIEPDGIARFYRVR